MSNKPRQGQVQRLETLRQLASLAAGKYIHSRDIIQALRTVVVDQALVITPRAVRHLNRNQAQQDLVNSSIAFCMRVHGPEATYELAYRVYTQEAKRLNVHPFSLKTFQNRALTEYGAPEIAPLHTIQAVEPAV